MLLLRNATVFAPESLGVLDVLAGGEQVLWMGTGLPTLPAALGVREVDLGGRRVIPGLIDGHAHLTGGGGEAGPATRSPAPHLSHNTAGGVTPVVGVLGTDDVTGTVRGDIAHIDRIIGVGEVAISDHRSCQPTLDELLRLASEAHVGGLMSGKAGVLHLHVGEGARGLELIRQALDTSELPARVFNPTHVNRKRALFEEAIALAARAGAPSTARHSRWTTGKMRGPPMSRWSACCRRSPATWPLCCA